MSIDTGDVLQIRGERFEVIDIAYPEEGYNFIVADEEGYIKTIFVNDDDLVPVIVLDEPDFEQ
jgi:hypothetical protein